MSYVFTKFVHELTGLTVAEKAVAGVLAYHANPDGRNSYPSMSTIAAKAGFKTRRHAQRVIRRLEKKGIIVAETDKSGGRSRTTRYRFNMGNSGQADALSAEESATESASTEALNCDNSAPKQRSGYRTKGPERSRKENNATSQASPLNKPVLPDWLPVENWNSYLDMRKQIRRPATTAAIPLLIQQLDKWRNQGQDVTAILDQSTMNSWAGLFEVGGGRQPKAQITTGSASENFRRLREQYS